MPAASAPVTCAPAASALATPPAPAPSAPSASIGPGPVLLLMRLHLAHHRGEVERGGLRFRGHEVSPSSHVAAEIWLTSVVRDLWRRRSPAVIEVAEKSGETRTGDPLCWSHTFRRPAPADLAEP